jgi:hypothetical protein
VILKWKLKEMTQQEEKVLEQGTDVTTQVPSGKQSIGVVTSGVAALKSITDQHISNNVKVWFDSCKVAMISCYFVACFNSEFSLANAYTAAMTGFIASCCIVGASVLQFTKFYPVNIHTILTTGILVMMADLLVHKPHFGNYYYSEALLVGFCASMLSFLNHKFDKYKHKLKL